MKPKHLATLALLTAVALILFTVEAQIPLPIPIPGIKLGLANIVTVFAVFVLRSRDGLLILAVRVFLGAIFSGNFATIFYSAAGGLLAILATIGLKKILGTNQIWIAGCLGAIAHSVGQMAVAVPMAGTVSLLIYLPVLIVCSLVSGVFTGLCAQLLINRGNKLWKTILQ